MLRVIAATILLVLVVAFLWFFKGGGLPVAGQNAGSTLRMQLGYEPATLDFSMVEDGISIRVLSALMTGLVSYDRDGNLKLEIARKIEKLDGGRRYRFTLRPWLWSDGKPVTASDFVFAMKRTLDPQVTSKLADLLFFVKGARAYKRGGLADFSKVGIVVLSQDVLEFQLETPISFFPHVLTLPIGYPQRADLAANAGPSTGPYKLTRWLHDQRIEIERNPNYPFFDEDAPARAIFQIIPEEATALNLFENGQVDVLFKLPALDFNRLKSRGVIREFPYFATYYIAFDQRTPPWNDRRARLAVAQAVDREAIVKAMGGTEYAAASWIPRGLPGFNPAIGIEHDRAHAKKSWGASAGAGVHASVLGYDSGSRNQTAMERVQSDLYAALGLRVELRNRDWKAYLHELATNPPPIYRFGWLSPFIDAYADLAIFESGNPNNYTGWRSQEYDRLLAQIAALEPGSPQRQKAIDRAQRILLEEDVVVIPIFHYAQVLVVSPRVEGFWVNGMGIVDYMKIRLK